MRLKDTYFKIMLNTSIYLFRKVHNFDRAFGEVVRNRLPLNIRFYERNVLKACKVIEFLAETEKIVRKDTNDISQVIMYTIHIL